MLAYLNGQVLPRSQATISVEDRGFIFGDGVYEVWRVIHGQLFEVDRHLARLANGLKELRIAPPEIASRDGILGVAQQLFSGSDLETGEGTLYLEITRGVAPRAHAFPPAGTAPTVYATVNKFSPPHDLRARGATAVIVPDVRWTRCNLKTLQLLPNVLAKQIATEHGALEALLVRDGIVTEGSHANAVGVIDGVVRTHPANNFILPGITRAVVLELAHSLGIPVREEPFTERDIPRLEELFLAGTTTDVMPIVKVGDQRIGNGAPGPISMRLYAALRAHMDASCPEPATAGSSPA
ncbi:MAG TPA: D-amino acid aminotransferase [Gemmatimonadaceae bacterium]|nr:D-amino acid aminotransferase [Gemmatimonadaceae bacterium]